MALRQKEPAGITPLSFLVVIWTKYRKGLRQSYQPGAHTHQHRLRRDPAEVDSLYRDVGTSPRQQCNTTLRCEGERLLTGPMKWAQREDNLEVVSGSTSPFIDIIGVWSLPNEIKQPGFLLTILPLNKGQYQLQHKEIHSLPTKAPKLCITQVEEWSVTEVRIKQYMMPKVKKISFVLLHTLRVIVCIPSKSSLSHVLKAKSQTSLWAFTEMANFRKKPKGIKGATSMQTQESLSLFPRLCFSSILPYSTVQIAELKKFLITNIKAQSNKAVVWRITALPFSYSDNPCSVLHREGNCPQCSDHILPDRWAPNISKWLPPTHSLNF